MADPDPRLRARLQAVLERWREQGLPTRQQIERLLAELEHWRQATPGPGLWAQPPLLATATLDDGWGHGLQLIETCALAIGMETRRIGLLETPDRIVARCRALEPQFLGLTILQDDLQDQATAIAHRLPPATRLLVGGPPFRHDPEWHLSFAPYQVCRNLADFLEVMLHCSESSGEPS